MSDQDHEGQDLERDKELQAIVEWMEDPASAGAMFELDGDGELVEPSVPAAVEADDTEQLLTLWRTLTSEHRAMVLWLAVTMSRWEDTYEYPKST